MRQKYMKQEHVVLKEEAVKPTPHDSQSQHREQTERSKVYVI